MAAQLSLTAQFSLAAQLSLCSGIHPATAVMRGMAMNGKPSLP
ncbi:hypothetical protein DDI_0807 [Dickeya dianthicola RNS04.9]|nr:hypothetical protein DDI_0807 [Dickeya dianthicola RNS04.9]